MTEEWKPLFDGSYEVSNFGRFRRATTGRRTFAGRLMQPVLLKIGYFIVQPTIDGRNQQFYMHRLVAEQFIGLCPDGCEVNHIDGNKQNNRVENLEYVTHKANMQHASRHGLTGGNLIHDESVVRRIRSLRTTGMSFSKIAAATGTSIAYAWNICNGKLRRKVA